MTLRRQIITAAILAGSLFSGMICWMAYSTYPLATPTPSAVAAFSAVVLLFWWLVGSIAAQSVQKEVNRTVAAIRAKLEDGISLRRRMDSQGILLRQFATEAVPMVTGLSHSAQQLLQQGSQLAREAAAEEELSQLRQLADECSGNLLRLSAHAQQQHAQAQLLEHDLADLSAHEPPLVGELEQLQQLARQCNLLALNAAIEAARSFDRTRGVGLLTEEMKQLSSKAENAARQIEMLAAALCAKASQSRSSAEPMREHREAIETELDAVLAIQDEQWDILDSMKRARSQLDGDGQTNLRQQMTRSAEAVQQAGLGLTHSLEAMLKQLHVAS